MNDRPAMKIGVAFSFYIFGTMKSILSASILSSVSILVGAVAGILFFGCTLSGCALSGCAASYGTLSRASAQAEQQSIDTYFLDRQNGALWRAPFYDSVQAWNTIDSSLTGSLAKDLSALRPQDSAGAHTSDFYGFERAILDARFTEIYSVTK